MKKIYVASSWRNAIQQTVVDYLRGSGFEVYDFKHPYAGNGGFHWSEIDPDWKNWKTQEFIAALESPIAEAGFENDMAALRECDACVLVLPCGKSAHLEAGYAAGAPDKKLCILIPPCIEATEPELMYKMADCVTDDIDVIVRLLEKQG